MNTNSAQILNNRYPLVLFFLLLVLIVWSGINPLHRFDWVIDNLLGFAFVPVLFFVHRKFPLSNLSYTAIFVFVALHVIGSHWTYQETPFGFTLADWFGAENRNHFEILEAVLAIVIGGGQGIDYIGSQGDIWDAQKDMLLAGIGAVIAMSVTFFVNWKYNRNFRQEWKESLSIKRLQPLGEVRIREMLEENYRRNNG